MSAVKPIPRKLSISAPPAVCASSFTWRWVKVKTNGSGGLRAHRGGHGPRPTRERHMRGTARATNANGELHLPQHHLRLATSLPRQTLGDASHCGYGLRERLAVSGPDNRSVRIAAYYFIHMHPWRLELGSFMLMVVMMVMVTAARGAGANPKSHCFMHELAHAGHLYDCI